jgi:hypothetical protein
MVTWQNSRGDGGFDGEWGWRLDHTFLDDLD